MPLKFDELYHPETIDRLRTNKHKGMKGKKNKIQIRKRSRIGNRINRNLFTDTMSERNQHKVERSPDSCRKFTQKRRKNSLALNDIDVIRGREKKTPIHQKSPLKRNPAI